MLPKIGHRIDGLPRPLTFVRDLEAFDGPILSEYRAEEGGLYLEKWCDRDGEGIERSLIVRTERRALAEYLARRMSMLELLMGPSDGVGFIVDRINDNISGVYLALLGNLPAMYLPRSDAYHDEALRPDWDTYPQNFLLDGDWDAKLLAKAERLYLDVHAFGFWTEPQTDRHLPSYIFKYNYDRGYPIVTAFNNMRAKVPKEMNAKSVGVSAGSPGVLTIEAPSHTANRLMSTLARLPGAVNAYHNLHVWARLKPTRAHEIPQEAAIDDLRRLCEKLGVDPHKVLPTLGQQGDIDPLDILVAGKLVAAYFRKLRKLLDKKTGAEFISVNLEEETPEQVQFLPDDTDDEEDYEEYDEEDYEDDN